MPGIPRHTVQDQLFDNTAEPDTRLRANSAGRLRELAQRTPWTKMQRHTKATKVDCRVVVKWTVTEERTRVRRMKSKEAEACFVPHLMTH